MIPWWSLIACSLAMGPEKVATVYVRLLAMGQDEAALGLLEADCPYLHRVPVREIERLRARVVEERDHGLTVSVELEGRDAQGGRRREAKKLDLVQVDGVWVVQCPGGSR